MTAFPSGKESLLPLTQPQSPAPKVAVSDVKCFVVVHHSAVLVYGALLECALALLYIIGGLYYLLFTAVLPLLGVVAGRRLDARLARTYLLYIALQTLLRISVIVNAGEVNTQTAEVISLLVDCLVIRATWTYVRLLSHVSAEERRAILVWRALNPQLKERPMEAIDLKAFI